MSRKISLKIARRNWEFNLVLCSRSYEESVNDPRNDRQERVTPRTYFLSNSLFRGRVLCVHRLSAFSRCVSLSPFLFLSSCLLSTSSSSSSFSIFSPLSFHEPFLCHRNRSYCSHRRAVAASSYPRQCHRTHVPRNRMAFSSVVWCTIRPCRFPTDRRSTILIVKSARTLFLLRQCLITFAVAWKNVN